MLLNLTVSCLIFCTSAEAFKILVLYPTPSYSHQRSVMALIERLVQRGHELFVVSPNAVSGLEENDNYTHVDVSFSYAYFSGEEKDNMISLQKSISKASFIDVIRPMANIPGLQFRSEAFLNFQRRIESEQITFDLAIVETGYMPHGCAMSRQLTGGAPIIAMTSLSAAPFIERNLGSVFNPSFVPSVLSDYTDRMSWWQKLENWYSSYYILRLLGDEIEAAARRFFRESYGPEGEGLVDGCWSNASLLLLASTSLYFYPRILGPNVIETGPMHLKTPEKLPKDLQEWLDGAEDGVIFFSLGSNFKSESLPAAAQTNFLKFFKELPNGYRVLWKAELKDGALKRSDNIMTRRWVPQESVLAHPKVRVFITQGGLQSLQEGVHFGVPMVGIPWFFDQECQVAKFVDAKIGVRLLPSELHSFDKIKSAIESVMYEESYLWNVRKLAALSRDFSAVALDKGVFWVEHVARHRGAAHLTPATADSSLFQYFCYDVISVVLVTIAVVTFASFLMCKTLGRALLQKLTTKRKQN